ncbi:glycosyl hydrolase [uncultured Draconibacterium sp.]|uniref:glycosyl hydrolase n=1 Tax=uncultured Draconibacterium sp. TaxID=1573823 RepID=UPI0032169FA5
MKRNNLLAIIILVGFSVLFSQCKKSEDTATSQLAEDFANPPNEAKPRVWWHWMNGNVTKDGIEKDLMWMKRSGIGGFQNFDAGLATPQVVENRLTYMTPEWKDAFSFATKLADSLDLEMAIAGSPGWSQTGGPWVEEKDGMKKLVWNEIRVQGGKTFHAAVPAPQPTTGTFQNIPLAQDIIMSSASDKEVAEYYQDLAVLAYQVPANDIDLAKLNPKVTSSGGNFTLSQLTDGDLATTNLLLLNKKSGYAWIQFEFAEAQTVKAISLVGGGTREQWGSLPPTNSRSLLVSDNGVDFQKAADLPLGGVDHQTIAIPATTSKIFRVTFNNPVESQFAAFAALMGGEMQEIKGTGIAEIVLHPVTRINHSEEKAGFAAEFDLEEYPTPETDDVIDMNTVVDLTDKLAEDGTLEWDVPEGNWKIVRYGYSLTGKENHPASPEATGLEVDKLDARAVKDYFENYLSQYKDATGGLMGERGLQYIITDSYEAGNMTWTPAMAQEFEKRRGYSLLPWMPVLTGQIIESSKVSEQFLWDWRKTISELMAENHYDQLTTILEQYGMKRYTEAHENGRLYIVDGMDVKRKSAVPMSAMWVPGMAGSSLSMAQADIRESASVAHIYGQNLVAAESLTAAGLSENAWSYCPENLKPTADLELANGLNRFVIHTSVHQPVDDKIPGLGLFIFGQWFNRHETWAGQAKSWTDYLARSSYMLQQGKFVADVVYYYGEDNNITGLFGHQLPDIPKGYNYDFINQDALENLLTVEDDKLITPSGMQYRVLVLDKNARKMSLPVLRKLAVLAEQGATICGTKPEMKASLAGDQDEFDRLVNEIWNSGKANITEKSVAEVLSALGIQPDFTYSAETGEPELLYVHRQLADTEIYWVNNRSDQAQTVDATFRVTGKLPEIWHPETGEKEAASYSMENGQTLVNLNLTPNDAVFVVFRNKTNKKSMELPQAEETLLTKLSGEWTVNFQPERGAPANATFAELTAWNENEIPGIKYFSGTAVYTKTIDIPQEWISEGSDICLDLGEVKNLAEISVNGKSMGTIWKKPFRISISDAIQPGKNELAIQVTNLWVNRLIGDSQPDATEKITYTTMPFYRANSPLLTSGLIGPVQILKTN